MNSRKSVNDDVVADTAPGAQEHSCRHCHGKTYRYKSGLIDLFIKRESIMHDHQCDSYRCNYQEYERTAVAHSGNSGYHPAPESRGCACPRCQGETFRAERRLIDLLISRVSLVHRYQCDSRQCGWSGLVRQDRRVDFTGI